MINSKPNTLPTRYFDTVSKYKNLDIDLLPTRATQHSAGYDLKSAETITIDPGKIKLVSTGIKVYLQPDEVLYVYDRSSNPKKRGIVLINSVGVIDSDYVDNPNNEGEIFLQFLNITENPITITQGLEVAQGIFQKFLTVDNENSIETTRNGGFGSTTK